ncbi:MAG: hypothetical protein WDN04_13350 [Rhodospirillales bacterium]
MAFRVDQWFTRYRNNGNRRFFALIPEAGSSFLSRHMKLRVLRHDEDNGRKVVRELAPFEWVTPQEGEFAKEPALSAPADIFPTNDVLEFIQAMVDLGEAVGLTPSRHEDRSAEIKRLEGHLADMRRLALRDVPLLQTLQT